MTRTTLGRSRVRESRTLGSVGARQVMTPSSCSADAHGSSGIPKRTRTLWTPEIKGKAQVAA